MAGGLPDCGLYRTIEPVGSIPEGRLVFFHNHGDPGPGVYLPESWKHNRATFSKKGTTVSPEEAASKLQPLLAEGLYRVEEEFFCCEKNCRRFPSELLVQLGYDGSATPILFIPEWASEGLSFPERGQRVDALRLSRLGHLLVAETEKGARQSYH